MSPTGARSRRPEPEPTPEYGTVVLATDGSAGAARAGAVAADLADRFDADLHAVYVVDERSLADVPEDLRGEVRASLRERGERTLDAVRRRVRERRAGDGDGPPDDEDEADPGGADAVTATATDAGAGAGGADRADTAGAPRTPTTALRAGRPVREVLDYAGSVGADLVAAGVRGRHAESYRPGSVATALVRSSPVPVLTVRGPE